MALMVQKTAWGSIVFVVASVVPGFAGKPARFMATECLKEEVAMMDLNSMDQRHLSFAKFKDTIGGEMHRQPLNGSIWQDGSHIPSEAAWRVRVAEQRDKGAREIRFEVRAENIGELNYWPQSRTRNLTLHSTLNAIINREFQAQARAVGQSEAENEAKRRIPLLCKG